MNKTLRVILNILIVIASLVLLVYIVDMISSFKYANREVEDPAETYAGVFEYLLDHRAYGEITDDYYCQRLDNWTPKAGYENLYKVAEYAHTAFMTRVYDEKGDKEKAALCREKTDSMRKDLGDYKYTADEVDTMIEKSLSLTVETIID